MAHDVSSYLLAPRRNLRTACRQIRMARGLPAASCGACDNFELCPVRLAELRRKAIRRPGLDLSGSTPAVPARLKRAS